MPVKHYVLPQTFVSSETDYYSNGTLQGNYGPWSTSVNVRDEYIVYEAVPGRNNFNNCSHTKIGITPGAGCTIMGTDGMRRVFSGWYGAGMPTAFPNTPPVVDLKTWSATAFEAMSNPLRGNFLAPNFLGDLVSTALGLRSIVKSTTKKVQYLIGDVKLTRLKKGEFCVPCFKKISKKRKGKIQWTFDLLKILKTGASTHLSWVYGVKPMDSDIKYLCDAYLSATDRIEKYLAKEGLNQSVHYRKTILKNVETNTYSGSLYGIRYRVRSTANQAYNAGMSYSYNLPLMFERERRTRAWLDLLGFNPGAVIFEAIPFSFVTGWFTNLPKVVEANDYHWLNPKITLGYFVSSVKSTVVDEFFKGHYSTSDATLVPQGTRAVTRYSRNYHYPEQVGLGFDDRFTLSQAAQAVSLGVQRL